MKKLNVILFFLGVGSLAYLVWTIGIEELLYGLRLLGWGLIPFIFCEGVAELIHTRGWRQCLDEPYRSLPLSFLFRVRMAGYAVNYLTPTAALGGEVTRAALLASNHPGPGAVSGVLIEKVSFSIAHVLIAAFGCFFVLHYVYLPRPLVMAMLCSGALVTAGVVTFLLLQRYGKLGGLVRWAAARRDSGPGLEKVASNFTEVDEAMRKFYRDRPFGLGLAVGWHMIGHSVGLIQTWLFFHWLNPEASWQVIAAIWLLGMWSDLLTFAIPMNAGSLEGSRIIALRAFGYSSLMGMTYGVALRFAQLFWAVVGIMIYGFLMTRKNGFDRSAVSFNPWRNKFREAQARLNTNN